MHGKFSRTELRELLLDLLGEFFVLDLELNIGKENSSINTLKNTPAILKRIEHLANLYFFKGYKEKQKISLKKLFPQDMTNDFLNAERNFLFLASTYLIIDFKMDREVEGIFRRKIFDAAQKFNREFDNHRREYAIAGSKKGGIVSLNPEEYVKNISELDFWYGCGFYLLRNILSMSRLSFAKYLKQNNTTEVFRTETFMPKFIQNSKNSEGKSNFFNYLDTLLNESHRLNKLDRFVFILSNIDFGQKIISNAFDNAIDIYKDQSPDKYRLASDCKKRTAEDYQLNENTYCPKAKFSIRAIQFFWLNNLVGREVDTLRNFDGMLYIDSSSLSISGDGDVPVVISTEVNPGAIYISKVSTPEDMIFEEDEKLIISSFLFEDFKQQKGASLTSLEYYEMEDSSMSADFNNKDTVIIQKNGEYSSTFKYYLVVYKEQFFVRKLIPSITDKDMFILKSSNEDYPELELKKQDFEIYGNIITSIKKSNFRN